MAFVHGKNVAVLVGVYDLSTMLTSANYSAELSAEETTTFGTGGAKTYIPGLGDAKISAEGLFDTTALSGSDAVLTAALASGADTNICIAMSGLVLGGRVKIGAGLETSYEVTPKVSDVVSLKAEFQGDGGIEGGIILAAAKSVATATTTNETGQDNSAASTNGGVGQIHITSNAQSSTTAVKVQHSTDNSTWADLATFATVAAGTKATERVAVAAGTTVNRYLRATSTTAGTGAVVYTVAFARR